VPSSSIPASTAPERSAGRQGIVETCAEILREQLPNFFRLYLNPAVVQACACLSQYVQTTWTGTEPVYQSFLANSFDEALSGSIKLARYTRGLEGGSPLGLVLDPGRHVGPFASASPGPGEPPLEFIPKLVIVDDTQNLAAAVPAGARFGFVVLVPLPDGSLGRNEAAVRALLDEQKPLLIGCVDRSSLAACREGKAGLLRERTPDVVLFDESFVEHAVPFAAFASRKSLYEPWNQPGRTTFHSTTFQPNTIASLHFVNSLRRHDPAFYAQVAGQLERIRADMSYRSSLLSDLYSPFLAKAVATLGFAVPEVKAIGHYIHAGGRQFFDGVAGVACSVRGHNPPTYIQEIESLPEADYRQAVLGQLKKLTGLDHVLPAVSGASAVENSLRLALVAQYPKRYVLAFKGGFGGKTLLALTGTANPTYKTHLDPLYENVLYVDPFAPTVLDDLEAVLSRHAVAVVQLELIQAVGGVRLLPLHVLRYLQENKSRWGYLLFVDEVQTGMYRTGPFLLSHSLGLTPDLLTLGKGTSDMMFPFGLTLYSDAVEQRLCERQSDLAVVLRQRHDYDLGYRTVYNTLKRAEETGLAEQVEQAGALFARLLGDKLRGCRAVRDVRVHGLLIAIELDTAGWPRRWFKKKVSWLYLLNMARQRSFPLVMGYCQYEPNVLKLTPPLSVTPDEVERVCATIASVVRRPWYRLLPAAVGALVRSYRARKRKREEVGA
jgi:acetylornithine/succinyldiaminopimelate/putrescine aminotransferase